jgi:hypothetical protein
LSEHLDDSEAPVIALVIGVFVLDVVAINERDRHTLIRRAR